MAAGPTPVAGLAAWSSADDPHDPAPAPAQPVAVALTAAPVPVRTTAALKRASGPFAFLRHPPDSGVPEGWVAAAREDGTVLAGPVHDVSMLDAALAA